MSFADIPVDDWTVERVVGTDDVVLAYLSGSPALVDESDVQQSKHVDHVRTIAPGRYECRVSDPLLAVVARLGQRVEVDLAADGTEVEATLPDAGLQRLLTEVADAGESVELLAKKHLFEPEAADAFAEVFDSADLSKPERATLEAAFFAGYFDEPPKTNAADLATSLQLPESTILNRIARVERSLFGIVL
ncbi:helix-turn-helix domain-containing protein [Haloarchaeobius sp. DFWS5]|uniref:helix-turn-helix domain-containing protein n=1 Tax=Haloarchaeobius sp. DFWS5 TaxID=3446114 RepID=UPI003EBA9470